MSECSLSGRGQGHVSNFYIVDLENFATASRRYTSDIHNSTVVGLFMTPETMGADSVASWLSAHCLSRICLQLNLQLHTIDLVRTCRISSCCTVAWQLARFQLTRRIARSLGDSWASCLINRQASTHLSALMELINCGQNVCFHCNNQCSVDCEINDGPKAGTRHHEKVQEVQLSPRDRAMRRVSWNLAYCHATVQKLLVRQVLNKSKLWSQSVTVRQCVINMCTIVSLSLSYRCYCDGGSVACVVFPSVTPYISLFSC